MLFILEIVVCIFLFKCKAVAVYDVKKSIMKRRDSWINFKSVMVLQLYNICSFIATIAFTAAPTLLTGFEWGINKHRRKKQEQTNNKTV